MNFNELFTDVRITPMENMKNLKAFADVTIAGHFVCKGFKVMDGAKGLWVSMPSRASKGGQWEDIFHPITAEGRARLFDIILEKFEQSANEKPESKPAPKKEKSAAAEEEADDLPPEDEIPF